MANITLSTSVSVCEDTSESFDLKDLIQQAGGTAGGSPLILQIYVQDGSGNYIPAPAGSFLVKTDSDTITVDLAGLPNFNGDLPIRILGTDGAGNLVTLSVAVQVQPVNDAPDGADNSVSIGDDAAYVFGVGDFGFVDAVEGHGFQGVVIDSLPSGGQLLVDGSPVLLGDEVSIEDITAGKFQFVPEPGFSGSASFEFQVRDDGGTAGECGGSDLDLTPNTFTFTVEPVLASLGDRVWVDSNANGVQDAGEVGKAGVTVELYTCVGDMPDTLVATQVTDAGGNYNFAGLTPGEYIVKFIAADGSVLSTANVGDDAFDSDAGADGLTGCYTLSAGQTETSVDAGFYEKAEIGDRVWLDANKNGIQDAGEAGVSGVTARLVDAGGNVVATATTDANGNYLFDGLTPGQYRVDFDLGTLPAGFAVTTKDAAGSTDTNDSDANPGTGETTYTTLESGESDLSWDMGIVATPARIGDRVWLDGNANGVQDAGEAGVSGVTIELKDAGGTVIGSTTTDASGNYFFDVEPGTYSIAVTAPAGFVVTGQNLGGNEATDSDIDPATGMSDTVTVAAGETNLDLDAGIYETASLGDRVWVDSNANGVQDAGEVGKAGVTVELYTCVGDMPDTLVATQVTDAGGNYNFAGLTPGEYIVKFIAADGSVLSTANVGDDAFDSDAGADGLTGCYTLSAGQTETSVDAGFYEKAEIGDRVWLDANKNGIQDAGEAGVSGVTARLVDADGNVVATATTDANGNYLFDGLTPGQYRVDFDLGTLPAGFAVTTKDAAGSTDTNDSDANPGTGETTYTTLESGESDLSWDMGIVATPARIGDRVWLDGNANGVQDAGEAGVSGVTIELMPAAR
ncbi:MAG: carboxypeptidase regulatory-like domain-containing protein [Zoogloeaceae bacterium]|nr:carboxypeptidase regulatory-like domain-containing protein [Zoogloeaceae bacterium]